MSLLEDAKAKITAAALRLKLQIEGMIPTRWRWCPLQPSPKQQVLIAGDFEEAFYGGAAGGGKSALLLMAALKYVDHPKYRAAILRRTYGALEQPDGLIEQSKEWLSGTGAEYFSKRYEWRFPSGASLRFGQIRHNGDLEKYQGGGYHFCVGKGTLVLLANGDYKAIEDIRVGDSLMTLEGSKKVTRCIPVRKEQCVKSDTYNDKGNLTGTQIQSITHSFLTSDGWLSYRDMYDEFHLSDSFLSRLFHISRIPVLSYQNLSRFRGQNSYNQFLDQQPPDELKRLLLDHLVYGEDGVYLKDSQNDFLGFADVHRNVEQLPVLSCSVKLHVPSDPSKIRSFSLSDDYDNFDDRCETLLQDFQDDYRFYGNFYDEQLRQTLSTDSEHLLSLVCAEKPFRQLSLLDDQDSIHGYNRGQLLQYIHPYKSEMRTASEILENGTLTLTPVGIQDVYDITVEDVSHYITSSKLINKNCGFDELTQFTEYQYTYIFSRMRKKLTNIEIPLRIYSGSNPSHTAQWVHRHFIKKAIKEGPFTQFKDHYNNVGEKWTSIFVPAKLEDNPGLDHESYKRSLAHLDPVLRAQLLSGDWDIMPQGDIYPYQEPWHVITISEFANVFQQRFIPEHWRISMGMDWGASKKSTTAASWTATSARNSPLPDRKFIFREKEWFKPTEPVVAKSIIDVEAVRGEARRMDHRIISHDAATERLSFQQYYGLNFKSAVHSVTAGISVVRYHMALQYLDLPHPFRPDLNGQPLIYLVVPDDQGTCYHREVIDVGENLSPWIVDQPTDHDGLIDHRRAFSSYSWDEDGKAPIKGFGFDNIMDAVRMCGWKSFAMPKAYTSTERQDLMLPQEHRSETIWQTYEKTKQQDPEKALALLNNDMLHRAAELAIMNIIKKQTKAKNPTKVWQRPFGMR